MKLDMVICSVAALAFPVAAIAEPAKPSPLDEDTLTVVRPQVRQLREVPPTDAEPLPPDESLEAGCEAVVRAAPVPAEEPGTTTPPTPGDKEISMNRILLVDLGERELKKRDELRMRDLRKRPGTPSPDCVEKVEASP